MGDRLSGAVRPIKTDVHDILAEVKSLRNLLAHSGEADSKPATKAADPFYITLRFLLAERNKDYTKFVEAVFGDLDIAAHEIQKASTIEEVIKKAGGTVQILPDNYDFRALWQGDQEKHRLQTATQSMTGSWAMTTDKHVYLSKSMQVRLNDLQTALIAKLK